MTAISGTLAELIEHERGELSQIHAMVRCLKDVLRYADDDDSMLHANVAQVIARLLNESNERMELIRVRVAKLEAGTIDYATSAGPSSPPPQVREPRAHYLC